MKTSLKWTTSSDDVLFADLFRRHRHSLMLRPCQRKDEVLAFLSYLCTCISCLSLIFLLKDYSRFWCSIYLSLNLQTIYVLRLSEPYYTIPSRQNSTRLNFIQFLNFQKYIYDRWNITYIYIYISQSPNDLSSPTVRTVLHNSKPSKLNKT